MLASVRCREIEVFTDENTSLIDVTADIVVAYAASNKFPAGALPQILEAVHAALLALGSPQTAPMRMAKPTPAEIRRSIRSDVLISFIDGRPYRTLKRHLASHGLTPVGYRKRFDLPNDYPMVSKAYSEQRSEIAKRFALGVSPHQRQRLLSDKQASPEASTRHRSSIWRPEA